MKPLSIIFLLFMSPAVFAQKEKYDMVTYQPPQGWSKEEQGGFISYAISNNASHAWAKVAIYKSIPSKGTSAQNFESEWTHLVSKVLNISETPQRTPVQHNNGWEYETGSAKFNFNNAACAASLTTMTGYGKVISIIVMLNGESYLKDIQEFISNVKLEVPENITRTGNPGPMTSQKTEGTSAATLSSGNPTSVKAVFTTTNFDDGWSSVAKEDWIEITKGSTRVLLHHLTDKVDVSSGDYTTIGLNAWNTLVAPRYSNLENFYQLSYNLSHEPAYLLSGTLTENSSHRKVYVTLFRKGRGNWIEFICPDHNTFVQVFGIDKVDKYFTAWEPLEKMTGYNRFAVAASDFTGKWTTSSTSIQEYYNVYTGAYAGATSYSSAQTYDFNGSSYSWEIKAAGGQVGNARFQTAKSSGSFKVLGSWQIFCSDIEGKPKTFDVYFSFVKGGRILWMSDVQYPGYTAFFKAQ